MEQRKLTANRTRGINIFVRDWIFAYAVFPVHLTSIRRYNIIRITHKRL